MTAFFGRTSRVAIIAALLGATFASAQVITVPELDVPRDLPFAWYAPSGSFDLAAGRDGRVLFTWSETEIGGSQASRDRAIASRLMSFAGPTFTAIVRLPIKGAQPEVAVSNAGEAYLQAWTNGKDYIGQALFARPLDGAGAPLGSATEITGELHESYGVLSIGADRAAFGHVVAWGLRGRGIFARRIDADGIPAQEIEVAPTSFIPAVDVATTSDGGFVVAWTTGTASASARSYLANGTPKTPAFTIGSAADDRLEALAASPVEDVLAAVFLRLDFSTPGSYPVVLIRFTSDGILLDGPTIIADRQSSGSASAAFDLNGNLYVIWGEGQQPLRAQGFDRLGQAIGPVREVSASDGVWVRTARLPDGNFVNLWSDGGSMRTNVTSLCTPGTSVCGDGALDPFCELCDDGAVNSDTAADACRTDCRPAHCSDGVVDAGETCDDGGTADCDGCSAECQVEVGIGCGDGVAFPSCGETCDDANAVEGDGCALGCTLERSPGGGSLAADCYTAWSIDNPANEPRFVAPGVINPKQVCVDDDPRCDFDGGIAGSCTFRLQVCVNNTDQPSCQPGTRLASWELRKPSASQAATRPAFAAIRNALVGAVLQTIVGPDARDLCTQFIDVPVPLRGTAGRFAKGKVTLSTRATPYGGEVDSDKLSLECRPAP